MPPSVEGAGVALAYVERGEGPAVLLVHDLASDAETLDPQVQALSDAARVIAYDRRGYGSSGAPEPYGGTTVQEQAEDAAALLRELDAAPAVVCGEGFGALVALDLMTRHAGLVRGAVLSDPPLLALVPEATAALAAERERIRAAVRERGNEAGVEAWLDDRAGAGALERARAAHRAFYADYAGLASWPVTRRGLRALSHPAVVVTGPSSAPTLVSAADRLAELLPAARRATDGDLQAAARSLLP
jgi:pimeloyl-ACP methyl ester carboxylesterase